MSAIKNHFHDEICREADMDDHGVEILTDEACVIFEKELKRPVTDKEEVIMEELAYRLYCESGVRS